LQTELLINQTELFGDQISDHDIAVAKKQWIQWMSTDSENIPHDYQRVDLMFAEECRYINSLLYAQSQESHAYLLAMQLMLSISDNECGIQWGNGHNLLLENIDASVRPSQKYSRQVHESMTASTENEDRKKGRKSSEPK
jgi:hypothetical protein